VRVTVFSLLMKFLSATLILVSFSNLALAQTSLKASAYFTNLDYENGISCDSFQYELKPVENKFIKEVYRIRPLNRSYGNAFLQDQCSIVYDGENLFLNLKKLRMIRGFRKFQDPDFYQYFIGRPLKPVFGQSAEAGMALGMLGVTIALTAEAANTESMTREYTPYVVRFNDGKIFPFTISTLQRFLDPYPELLNLYSKDPNWKTLETMKVYLEILNEMIETEKPE
jgi:hypothetical protein